MRAGAGTPSGSLYVRRPGDRRPDPGVKRLEIVGARSRRSGRRCCRSCRRLGADPGQPILSLVHRHHQGPNTRQRRRCCLFGHTMRQCLHGRCIGEARRVSTAVDHSSKRRLKSSAGFESCLMRCIFYRGRSTLSNPGKAISPSFIVAGRWSEAPGHADSHNDVEETGSTPTQVSSAGAGPARTCPRQKRAVSPVRGTPMG